MKIRLFIFILASISIAVFSVIITRAQDCSLNGATPTDNCPAGTTSDDVFIITGEVNTTVSAKAGNDTIDMSKGGFIVTTSGVSIRATNGDLLIIGGNITTTGNSSIVLTGYGNVVNSADIINYGSTTILGRVIQQYGDGSIYNYGNITSYGPAYHGIIEFDAGDVVNYGTIYTTGAAARGIYELSGDVINYGYIRTTGTNSADGIEQRGDGKVINYGTVISEQGVAINATVGSEDNLIINNGTATGAKAAINTGISNDTIINNGTANGDILTSDGTDTVTNNGTVNGNINLGAGNDRMFVNGPVNGMMDGGPDTDRIVFVITITGSPEDYEAIAKELASKNPQGGKIVINGQLYQWKNFEDLLNRLHFVDTTLPCATDGRINLYDCQAPVAIYGYPIQIYGIDPNTSEGHYAFTLSQAMVDAAGIPATGTVLIYQGTHPVTGVPIAIYRHANGDFQINTYYPNGKPYVGIWTQYGGFVNHSGEYN